MEHENPNDALYDVPLEGIKGHSPTPDLGCLCLDPQRELIKSTKVYDKIYSEIRQLVQRMTSLKIYSCDEDETYDGVNGFLSHWLDWDKVSLALRSAELEIKRIEILHWVALRQHTPLPAEIITIIQRMVLDWKRTVHLTPFEQVEDKHGLRSLLATSGLAEQDTKHEWIMSGVSTPRPPSAPVTAPSEDMSMDSLQALDFALAPDCEGVMVHDMDTSQLSLGIDTTRDSSLGPLMDIAVQSQDHEIDAMWYNQDPEGD